eukprot:gene7367-13103_t
MAEKKFRSLTRKKRKKVFYGKGNKESENSLNSQLELESFTISSSLAEDEAAGEPRPGPSHQRSEIELALHHHSTPDDKKTSRSQHKLDNSSFLEFENSIPQLTRSARVNLGLKTPTIEEAHGYKLQDFTLLQQFLNKATVCRKCRKSKSELVIKQINSQRDGLDEKCVVTCKNCNFSYNLETSKQIGGKGGGSYEVNRRSVIATMSSGGGRSSLQNFCTQMNPPAPISQPAFAAQVKFIESASVTHAEEVMRAAAQRLRDLISSENPELIDEDSDGALP